MNIEEANNLVQKAIQSFQANQYQIAQPLLEKILDSYPQHSRANEFLGYIKGNLGDSSSSHKLLRIACEDPNCSPQALYYLGSSFLSLDCPDDAIQFLSGALKKAGPFFEGLHDLAMAQAMIKKNKEAIENFKLAATINPQSSEVFYNLGKVYDSMKNYQEAIRNYDSCIKIFPDFAQAHFNKASALSDLGAHEEAVTEYRCAQKLMPDMELLSGNLIHAQMKICDWHNLKANINKLFSRQNDRDHLASDPFAMLSISNSEALNFQTASGFAKKKFPNRGLGIEPSKKKEKIVLGYFSANFHNHAVAFLISEIFEKHDRDKFHLIAFSFGPDRCDEMRMRIRDAFDSFIDVRGTSDADVASLSRSLEVDIAIDLMGYTQDGRSAIFSHRAAPIQINYLGYPGTMGINYIDYVIADPTVIPESNRKFYAEKIIYLPNCYQANDRKRAISERVYTRKEMGLPDAGLVFCCFNQSYKITPDIFDDWAKILDTIDGSVLWLLEDSITAVKNLKQEAADRGISPNRLVFAKRMPLKDHLARMRLADLFLDTLPYNAHTTASDALWAGLPVITCIGETFPGRVAASLLTSIGLTELITHSREEYVDLAVKLAKCPEKIYSLKNKLSINRLTTPLFDSTLFTKNMEDAFLKAYDRFRNELAPDHLFINND
jgi:protein O-GlcNAc transferase